MTVLFERFTIDLQSTKVASALLLFYYPQEVLSIYVRQFARTLARTAKSLLTVSEFSLLRRL